jgi:hypothetical protein
MPGTTTSTAEVTNISRHGFWMLVDGRELFSGVRRVPLVQAGLRRGDPQTGPAIARAFYWPDLDVDLGLDSIEHPERHPLKSAL